MARMLPQLWNHTCTPEIGRDDEAFLRAPVVLVVDSLKPPVGGERGHVVLEGKNPVEKRPGPVSIPDKIDQSVFETPEKRVGGKAGNSHTREEVVLVGNRHKFRQTREPIVRPAVRKIVHGEIVP